MTGIHQVTRNAHNAQPLPEWPIENYVDTLTGQRLRREYLGSCTGGRLLLGSMVKSTGRDLYYVRVQGHARRPAPSELDAELRQFITKCWHQQLRLAGKPVCQRQGNLVWLVTVPIAIYGIENTASGGSILCRYRPIIMRPRAALPNRSNASGQ